jgi:hypothetical protein
MTPCLMCVLRPKAGAASESLTLTRRIAQPAWRRNPTTVSWLVRSRERNDCHKTTPQKMMRWAALLQ